MPSKSAPAVHALWSPKGYTVGLSALPNFTTIPKMLCEMDVLTHFLCLEAWGRPSRSLPPPPLLAGDFFFFPRFGRGHFYWIWKEVAGGGQRQTLNCLKIWWAQCGSGYPIFSLAGFAGRSDVCEPDPSSHQPFPPSLGLGARWCLKKKEEKKNLNVLLACIHPGLEAHPRVVTAALAFCFFSVTILPTTCITILTLFSLKQLVYFYRFLENTMFTTIGFGYYCLFTFSCLFVVLGWNPGPYAKCSIP